MQLPNTVELKLSSQKHTKTEGKESIFSVQLGKYFQKENYQKRTSSLCKKTSSLCEKNSNNLIKNKLTAGNKNLSVLSLSYYTIETNGKKLFCKE